MHHRTRHDGNATERIFSEEWIRENVASPGVNFGHGTLQDLMAVRVHAREKGWNNAIDSLCGYFSHRWAFVITRRDAKIVATVVEWFGTNCGWSFLERTLLRCGYRLVERTDMWNARAPIRECTSRTSTWAGNCPHCGRMLNYDWTLWPQRYDSAELYDHRHTFGVNASPPLKVYECGRCGGRFTVAEWRRERVSGRLRSYLLARIPKGLWGSGSREPSVLVDEARTRA
jgi:hypothetical protein